MQAVGADQVHVARDELGDERVDGDAPLDADGARDDVAVLGAGCVGFADEAALELLLDHAVVLGELVRAIVAEEIDAAVADVGEHGVASTGDQRHQRRAHAAPGRIGDGERVHLGARLLHRPLDQLRGVLPRLDRGRGREAVEHRPVLGQRIAQCLQRGRAGDFAGGVSAHSVRDGIEAERLVGQIRVLVVRAFLADVRSRPMAEDGHRARTLPRPNRVPAS